MAFYRPLLCAKTLFVCTYTSKCTACFSTQYGSFEASLEMALPNVQQPGFDVSKRWQEHTHTHTHTHTRGRTHSVMHIRCPKVNSQQSQPKPRFTCTGCSFICQDFRSRLCECLVSCSYAAAGIRPNLQYPDKFVLHNVLESASSFALCVQMCPDVRHHSPAPPTILI